MHLAMILAGMFTTKTRLSNCSSNSQQAITIPVGPRVNVKLPKIALHSDIKISLQSCSHFNTGKKQGLGRF